MEIRAPKTEFEWEAYYDLRYRILRAPLNQPLGSERNDGDLTGQHFALFYEGNIAAIARLDQAEEGVSQVRFVAVDDTIQGKGFGRIIMEATEKASIEQGNRKNGFTGKRLRCGFLYSIGVFSFGKESFTFWRIATLQNGEGLLMVVIFCNNVFDNKVIEPDYLTEFNSEVGLDTALNSKNLITKL